MSFAGYVAGRCFMMCHPLYSNTGNEKVCSSEYDVCFFLIEIATRRRAKLTKNFTEANANVCNETVCKNREKCTKEMK